MKHRFPFISFCKVFSVYSRSYMFLYGIHTDFKSIRINIVTVFLLLNDPENNVNENANSLRNCETVEVMR